MEQVQSSLVSVIIPTYGARGNLKKAIDSVIAQDYSSLEIIVVDDNDPETDARRQTELLMDAFSSVENVLYIKHSSNRNGAAARNTGLFASHGQFIAFLDDDDLFLAGKLSKQVSFLERQPAYAGVYCYADNDLPPRRVLQGDLRKKLLLLETRMYTPSLMFRRESLMSIRGFDESFRRHQDYELLMRFFGTGFLVGCVPESLIHLGGNAGENVLNADKLCLLKQKFLTQFDSYISELSKTEFNYKNRVIAKHYSTVVLAYLKERNIRGAMNIFFIYCTKAPIEFFKVSFYSLFYHLKHIFVKK